MRDRSIHQSSKSPVRFMTCTSASDKAWSQTPAGQSHWYLAQDSQVQLRHVFDVLPEQLDAVMAQQQQQGLQDIHAGHISGLVWVHSEVVIHDFLAARRLQAYWARSSVAAQRLGIVQHEGRVLLRAVSASAKTLPEQGDDIRAQLALSLHQQPLSPIPPAREVPPMLVVTASRQAPESFYKDTALGRSIGQLRQAGADIRVHAACNNKRPLAEVYNRAVTQAFAHHLVVFAHDDLQLNDHHLPHRLALALDQYDLVGVAGCVQRHPGQPTWFCAQHLGQWSPAEQLLGTVAHDTTQHKTAQRKIRHVSHYGPGGHAQLLDGLLLAVRGQTWLDSGLRFDPELAFHFYDLDLCRSAEQKGLRMGVEPLAVTHLSGGAFRSPDWQTAYAHYLNKWGECAPSSPP